MAKDFEPDFVSAEYQTIAVVNFVWGKDGQVSQSHVEIADTIDEAVLAKVSSEHIAWYSLGERVSATFTHPNTKALRDSLRGNTFTLYNDRFVPRSEDSRFAVDREGDKVHFQNRAEILGGTALTPYMSKWLGALTRRGRYHTPELTELQKML